MRWLCGTQAITNSLKAQTWILTDRIRWNNMESKWVRSMNTRETNASIRTRKFRCTIVVKSYVLIRNQSGLEMCNNITFTNIKYEKSKSMRPKLVTKNAGAHFQWKLTKKKNIYVFAARFSCFGVYLLESWLQWLTSTHRHSARCKLHQMLRITDKHINVGHFHVSSIIAQVSRRAHSLVFHQKKYEMLITVWLLFSAVENMALTVYRIKRHACEYRRWKKMRGVAAAFKCEIHLCNFDCVHDHLFYAFGFASFYRVAGHKSVLKEFPASGRCGIRLYFNFRFMWHSLNDKHEIYEKWQNCWKPQLLFLSPQIKPNHATISRSSAITNTLFIFHQNRWVSSELISSERRQCIKDDVLVCLTIPTSV